MKTYLEEHSDATRIFPWLADASSSIRCLCVVGEMLFFQKISSSSNKSVVRCSVMS